MNKKYVFVATFLVGLTFLIGSGYNYYSHIKKIERRLEYYENKENNKKLEEIKEVFNEMKRTYLENIIKEIISNNIGSKLLSDINEAIKKDKYNDYFLFSLVNTIKQNDEILSKCMDVYKNHKIEQSKMLENYKRYSELGKKIVGNSETDILNIDLADYYNYFKYSKIVLQLIV